MRATTLSIAIAVLGLASLAACSDSRNEPLAPRAPTAYIAPNPYPIQCTPSILTCASVNFYAVNVSAGSGATCAVRYGGGLYCWGENDNGILGVGSTVALSTCTDRFGSLHSCSTKPVAVAANGMVFSFVSVGLDHACAIQAGTGAVFCWGSNLNGQLGIDPSIPRSSVPVAVAPPTGGATLAFSSIAAGGNGTCGITTSQQLFCWGSTTGFVPTQTLGSYKSVTVGYPPNTICSLTTSGASCAGWHTVDFLGTATTASSFCEIFGGATGDGFENTECWGSNDLGQLGSNTGGASVSAHSPALIAGYFFQSVSTGMRHSCAIQVATSAAFCWGDRSLGELGDQVITSGSTYVPQKVVVPSGVTFTGVAAGDGHTCAIDNSQLIRCWGEDDVGQAGVGVATTAVYSATIVKP